MSFGPAQLNSAVSQLDEKIAELETAIASASNDAQARISRDLKRAWEGVYNALSFSPTPTSQSPCSYSAWAANSSPRFPPNANVPLEPQQCADDAGRGEAKEPSIHDFTGSTLCDGCKQHVSDVLWVCISCRGRHRLCNGCKSSSSKRLSSEGAPSQEHRFVAWPVLRKTIKDGQCVMCDNCNKAVVGIRWVCMDCESYDMCSDCVNTTTHEHPLKPVYTSETSVHPLNAVQYTCNSCSSSMDPPVFGCLQCNDFHVCLKCTGLGKMCADHDYAAINVSSSHAASDSASPEGPPEKAAVDDNEVSSKREGKQTASLSTDSQCDAAPQANKPKDPSEPMAVTVITCNECNKSVVGIRHKCTRCKDYDLCDNCYRSVSTMHPGHGFVHFGPPPPPQQRPLPSRGHPYPHPHPHPHPHLQGHRHPGSAHHHHRRPAPMPMPHAQMHMRPSPPHHHHHHQHNGHPRHQHHFAHAGGPAFGPFGGLQACRIVLPPMDSTSPTRMSPPFPPHAAMGVSVGLPKPILPPFPGCTLPRLPACNDKQQQTESIERAERGTDTDEEPAAPKSVHTSVCCDACNKLIVGVRFKCGNCLDYDLCEKCEAVTDHNSEHLLIKIREPRLTPNNKPMLPMVYPLIEQVVRTPKQPSAVPAFDSRRSSALSPALNIPRRAENDSSNIMQTTKYVAVYVEDVTVPDGTVVSADEMFVKIWSVANVGNTEWPHGTMLVHMGGEPSIRDNRKTVPIVVGKRYEQVGIAVDLVAPSEPGIHKSKWRLMTPDGFYFGSELWCSIVVENSCPSSVAPPNVPSPSQSGIPHPYIAICPAKPDNVDAQPAVPSPSPSTSHGLGITPSPVHSTVCEAADSVVPTSADTPRDVLETLSVHDDTPKGAGGSSDAVVENVSDIFVKIGADLMHEIRRLDQSVKELQQRQDKLDADRSFEITSTPKEGSSVTTQFKAYPQEALAPDASEPAAATAAAGRYYSDVDLTSPPLNAQHHISSPVSAAGSDARSDTSSMREFYSSAARLEHLLNSSRTTATSSMSLGSHTSSSALKLDNSTVPHSSSHSYRSSSSSSDDANGFEFVNDFASDGKASPKDI